jgi:hypothetical protein
MRYPRLLVRRANWFREHFFECQIFDQSITTYFIYIRRNGNLKTLSQRANANNALI